MQGFIVVVTYMVKDGRFQECEEFLVCDSGLTLA